jgi:hypothetical protein
MYRCATCIRSVLTLIFFFGAVISASAQEGIYVQGSAFADVREFGSSSSTIVGPDDESSLDAVGAGGSIRVGTWLHRRWTIEAGLDLTTRTTNDFRNPYILAIFPPGLAPLDLSASTSFASVTTMLGFHQRADWVRFGYRAGFSFMRATYRTEFPDFAVPLSNAAREPFALLSTLLPTLPTSRLDNTTLTRTENNGALALGFEAAIELADNLEVVPELRAFAFSSSGQGTFLIRPGVGARWTF